MSARPSLHLTLHTLLVADLEVSVAFYVERLGMQLLRRVLPTATAGAQHALLSFPTPAGGGGAAVTRLHLVQRPAPAVAGNTAAAGGVGAEGNTMAGYWKIAITLADVDAAALRLRAAGIEVSEPMQFRDIGYLCHFRDPDGHTIELLQHTFGACDTPATAAPNEHVLPLGGPGHFGLITLRVKDPQISLGYYRDVLGMRLLSRQEVAPHRFTLYFLAFTDEAPPLADVDAVANRPWLWQRPYTVLELQHRWGSEEGDHHYRVGDDTGFNSISLAAADAAHVAEELVSAGLVVTAGTPFAEVFGGDAFTTHDPDGYALRIVTVK